MQHHLQAQKSMDFEQLTDLIFRLLKAAWGDDWGTFCEAFPNGRDPLHVKMPVITYTLKQMKPAQVGKGTREIKPRYRDEFFEQREVEGNPQATQIYGQIMEHEIVFEIWEENNAKANKLAKRFRDFMRMYTGYLMSQGAQQLLFDSQNNEKETDFRDNVVCRKQVYKARLEDLIVIPTDVITKVTGSITISDDLSDNPINEGQSIDFKSQ